MTDEGNESKKPLTRNEILKGNNGSKAYQLPSGKTVLAAYLSLGMVQEIEKSVEHSAEGDKEHLLAQKVVEWMLRESDKSDYLSFSSEDRYRLIEIAVEEWGCEDEYERLTDINVPEVRFYQAVRLQEKELAKLLSESARAISINISSIIEPLRDLQIELATSLKEMLDQSSQVDGISEILSALDTRIMDQVGDIYRFQPPILDIAEEIAKIQSSSVVSTQKSILESVGGTISSYQTLMKDILPVERFAVLPDSVRYFPTIEMHNTSIVAAHIVDETSYETQYDVIAPETTELSSWLESLDPSFPNMLHGAEQTIYSQNPDHFRHFASSHRELSTHVLHLLAPDIDVKQWTKDPNHYDKDGKPFRSTRLKYIARNHNNSTFVDFLVKDFENQMALLNADEHRQKQEYTDQELLALHRRFLGMLGFLREIVSSHS
ncbi:MAG: hypothetical protein C3F13_08290 [Anaerolineales bacterium]|nr:MAG: hypothetical protein C3F13_08290 [Anaerolineales bacterium]